MKTTSLTAAVLLCAVSAFPVFVGPVTDTNRSNVAAGGDAAGMAPACPIPLERGATWTYRGLVLWYRNEAVQSQEMTWVTTVVATYDGPAARTAVISGYPDELAWYEPGRTPKDSVLVVAGSNVYHINRAYRTNDCEKLTREECMALAQRLAQSPTAIPAEYQDKLPLLVLPLAKGAKWNDDTWRGDNAYCWYVQEAWTTQVAQLAGRTAVVYEVIYLTNPDHSIMQIVPGLGITRYVYEHHGTPAAADMQLVSFRTRNEESVSMVSNDAVPLITRHADEPGSRIAASLSLMSDKEAHASVSGRDTVGASMLAPQNAIVRTRQVEFTWPRVEGARTYTLQVRTNPDLGKYDANIIVNEAFFGNEHTQRIDLAAIQSSAVGKTLHWGIQARLDDDEKTSADWMGPVSFTYQPRNVPVEASDVRVSIGYESAGAVADGQSALRVTAVVTDRQGRPVVDEQVRFVEIRYMEAEDGSILGSEDKWQTGCSYRDAASGGYLQDEENHLSNLYTTRTDADGRAHARYRMPAWRPFMRTKPMALGVWYHVDGGGNPYVRTNLWPAQPLRRSAAFAPSWTSTNDSTMLPAVSPYHIVQRGDTLWSISRTYGCRISELAVTNALEPSAVLRVGQKLIIPVTQEKALPKSGIVLRLIPAGDFIMGSPTSEKGRGAGEVQHAVTISTPFYIGKYEVTQGQWQKVMGNNPSKFKKVGKNGPVERVSWNDCQEFLSKLEKLEGLPEGSMRLPMEAEWEYACRAGTQTAFCYGDDLDSSMENVKGSQTYGKGSKGVYRKRTVPVGSFKPNAWGLYDMHGNVWEWCADDVVAGCGENSGSCRVIRGGGWNNDAAYCRSANRGDDFPGNTHADGGFRLCLPVGQ